MYNYDRVKQCIEDKKDADFKALKDEISGVENFIEKCFKFVLESSSSISERDFNITSL